MSEIKTEIKQNADESYTITDKHSTADIVRWLLTQDSKETILYLLQEETKREWQGLTMEDKKRVLDNDFGGSRADCMDAAEKILREKNT